VARAADAAMFTRSPNTQKLNWPSFASRASLEAPSPQPQDLVGIARHLGREDGDHAERCDERRCEHGARRPLRVNCPPPNTWIVPTMADESAGRSRPAARASRIRSARVASKPSLPPKTDAVAPSAAASVLQHLRELYRVSQQHFQRIEARCGLSGAQLWALSQLQARPGSTVSELAVALSIHLSTASNLLDRLEDRKLVRRHRGPPDQRVVRVTLTAEGERTLRLAPKPAEGIIHDALQRMSEDALVRLNHDLETLLRHAHVRNQRAGLKHLAEP